MTQGSSTVTLAVTMTVNTACAIAKILAYAASGSSAVLSEAIHSLAGIAHQALMLVGIQKAEQPADARHAFGHAKEIYFWSFIAAILLFSHGAGVAIYEGIQKIKNPPFLGISVWTYAALLGALVLQVALLAYRRMSADDTDHGKPVSAALSIENIAAVAGTLVALAAVVATDQLGLRQGDAMASLAVGFVMAATAAVMSLRVKGIIVGQAAHPGLRSVVRSLINAETAPGRPIATIHDVRTLQLGLDDVLVAANVAFREGETAQSVEETTVRVERRIKAELPNVSHVFLAVQPVGDEHLWDDDAEDTDPPSPAAPRTTSPHAPHRKHRKKRRRH